MTKSVIILGATGSAGRHAGTAFRAAGWSVSEYDRGTDLATAARGCDVIVNAMNPPNYHNWAVLLPRITRQVIDAARQTGATVILPGNVYPFGDQPGPWSQATPNKPCSDKGRIRAEIEHEYATSGVSTIILRAGDFIAADIPSNVMGRVILPKAHLGRLTTLGRSDAQRTYAYLPDWARAAVALAELRDTLPTFIDIPFPGHVFSIDDIAAELAKSPNSPIKIKTFPWWIMTALAPVWELARELLEMRYLYGLDHQLDDTVFNSLLPDFQASPTSQVMFAESPKVTARLTG